MLRQTADPRFVFLEQAKVSPSHGSIDSVPIGIRRDEEMFDHAVRTKQVETTQEQFWIWRNALIDGICEFKPGLAVTTLHCVLISLKQRYKTLNQHGEIKGVGFARTQKQAVLVKRYTLLHGEVAKL